MVEKQTGACISTLLVLLLWHDGPSPRRRNTDACKIAGKPTVKQDMRAL